jgi:hypothetical protein
VSSAFFFFAFLPPTEHAIADLYWIAFQDDRRIHQVVVYGLCVLETAQSISLTYDGFQQFVFGFGDPKSVHDSRDLWMSACIFDGFGECDSECFGYGPRLMAGLVALVFQLFFANRIRMLLPKGLKSTVITTSIVLVSQV